METIIVQLKNNKALNLLKELEDLNIIKMIRKSDTKKTFSERFKGSLKMKEDEFKKFEQYLIDIRKEW